MLNRSHLALFPCLFLALVVTTSSKAQSGSSTATATTSAAGPVDPEVEKLRTTNPDAYKLFIEGRSALAAGNWQKAADLFGRLEAMVPDLLEATRLRCRALASTNDIENAIESCKKPMAKEKSVRHLTMAVEALLLPKTKGGVPAKDAIDEARGLAKEAVALEPENPFGWLAQCKVSKAMKDTVMMKECTDKLLALAPDAPMTHYFSAIFAGVEKRWEDADKHVRLAVRAGADPSMFGGLPALIGKNLQQDEVESSESSTIYAAVGVGVIVFIVAIAILRRKAPEAS